MTQTITGTSILDLDGAAGQRVPRRREPTGLRTGSERTARNPQVVIVDQDLRTRAELQKTLALSRFAVVGESAHGVEALSLIQELAPDVVLVRVEEPVARPLQTIDAIVAAAPGVPIVVYSSLNDAASVRRAMVAGGHD